MAGQNNTSYDFRGEQLAIVCLTWRWCWLNRSYHSICCQDAQGLNRSIIKQTISRGSDKHIANIEKTRCWSLSWHRTSEVLGDGIGLLTRASIGKRKDRRRRNLGRCLKRTYGKTWVPTWRKKADQSSSLLCSALLRESQLFRGDPLSRLAQGHFRRKWREKLRPEQKIHNVTVCAEQGWKWAAASFGFQSASELHAKWPLAFIRCTR